MLVAEKSKQPAAPPSRAEAKSAQSPNPRLLPLARRSPVPPAPRKADVAASPITAPVPPGFDPREKMLSDLKVMAAWLGRSQGL